MTWCNNNKRANNRIISKEQLYISIYQARLLLKGVVLIYLSIANVKKVIEKARKESE